MDEVGMIDRSKPKHEREANGIFGFSFPTVGQLLDELENGKWECFVFESDQGGFNDLVQGSRVRGDTWTVRWQGWDTEIGKEINEWDYCSLVPDICQLNDCLLWAEFA